MQGATQEYKEASVQYEEAFYGIPRSFYGIPNYQETLSNTTKLYGIPGSSMEYTGAVRKYQEAPWNTKRL